MPPTENDEPRRANALIDMVLPSVRKSNTDSVDPKRVAPHTESDDPMRAKFLTANALPNDM
jgi:hypothetical protein